MKEKQQHIEQLMAERDMERAEVAKATSHVGEMEQEINLLRDDHEQVSNTVVDYNQFALIPCLEFVSLYCHVICIHFESNVQPCR